MYKRQGKNYAEGHAIAGTTDDAIYQTERSTTGTGFVYEEEVENGFYDVEIKLAEIWSGAQEAGTRKFSLKVEDEFVFNDLDLTKEAGFATALDYVGTIEVTDGALTIEAINGDANNAKLSGFSVWESDASTAQAFAQGDIFDFRDGLDAASSGLTTDDFLV